MDYYIANRWEVAEGVLGISPTWSSSRFFYDPPSWYLKSCFFYASHMNDVETKKRLANWVGYFRLKLKHVVGVWNSRPQIYEIEKKITLSVGLAASGPGLFFHGSLLCFPCTEKNKKVIKHFPMSPVLLYLCLLIYYTTPWNIVAILDFYEIKR